MLLVLGLGLGLGLAGCEMTPARGVGTPDKPPADFALSVTVFAPSMRVAGEPEPKRDPATTPARYILEPDGTLRAAVGPGATPETFPPIVRRVSDGQRQRLWWLTLDTAAHDPGPDAKVASPETYRPEGTDPEALITVSWLGGWSAAAKPLGDGSTGRALTAELARLAWVDQ